MNIIAAMAVIRRFITIYFIAKPLYLQITDWVNPASFLKKLFYDDVLPDERSHMVMVAMTHVLIIVDAYSAGGEISHSSKCRHYDCFFIRAHGN